MATYRQIADDVKSRTGRTVKTCWIAGHDANLVLLYTSPFG